MRDGTSLWGIPAALLIAACASVNCSPTAPSVVTPATQTSSGNLQIVGITVLTAVGQTSLLGLKTNDGNSITAGLSWQTSAATVASISAAGLVTAMGPGQATITASSPGGSAHVPLFVVTGGSSSAATVSLAACGEVKTPGNYAVTNDIGSGVSDCLDIGETAGVQVDCLGHTISSLSVSFASTVALANCKVTGALEIDNSANVTVTSSAVGGLPLINATSVVVSQTTITAKQGLRVTNGTNVSFRNDTVQSISGIAGVSLAGGTNNRVMQSTLTGGYDGGVAVVGADDGILLQNETGDAISGNTISGFYDAGLEGIDVVANATIAGNTFSVIGTAGIGAYWCTAWTGNTIQNNDVSQAPTLALVEYDSGANCGSVPSVPAFVRNQFIGNRFRSPIAGILLVSPTAARMTVDMLSGASGNLLQGNDFGMTDGPNLTPLDAFIDGGGNVCGPFNANVSNFRCGGPFPAYTAARTWRR